MADGSTQEYAVEDHAYRLFRERGGDAQCLPAAFVSALDMTAEQHLQMLVAVQPFIDSSISKTVNVPADYPFEAFRGLYLQAWKAGLKGLATYRPNAVTGAVLSVDSAAAVDAAPEDDPLCRQFASRPAGELEGLTSKVEFWTVEGKKSVYLTVNFVRVSGIAGGQPVVIERPVEFFVPAGQRDEGQQWISSNMRLLSMVARSGASISKALANMCEVVWDKGPVRCGFVTREDGAQAPRFHDSEVAAIGHALQQILARRGFLDSLGNQVPVAALARRLAARDQASTEATVPGGLAAATAQAGVENSNLANVANLSSGKKCPECGAHAQHKVDGCLRCANCHHIGSCG
jgi:ribonucleoside-diphosphate reductase alpha chain